MYKEEQAWMRKHRMRRGYNRLGFPLRYCRECRGTDVDQTLTTHCIGRMLTDAEEENIRDGKLDFENGLWLGDHPTIRRTL